MHKKLLNYFCSNKATSEIITSQMVEGTTIYNTKYGPLKFVKNTHLSDKQVQSMHTIHYLVNGVPSTFIRKVFKSEPNSLLVFDCLEMNYQNTLETYQASRRQLDRLYFGTEKQPKDPFKKCSSASEHFNLHRRILIEQKKQLSRLCLVVDYNGIVRLKGQIPECKTLIHYLDDTFVQLPNFKRYNFLMPFQSYQGILTAYNYEKEGIPIKHLGGKKIFPLYGVWVPSQQHYLDLLNQALEKIANYHEFLSLKQVNTLDLGCGTGVLGFIADLKFKQKQHSLYAIDINEAAVKSARLNSAALDVGKFRACVADITDTVTAKRIMLENQYPQKFNLIVANPPWLSASGLNNQLDLSVYDNKSQVLESIIKLSADLLEPKGRLLLIYSDLSEILELTQKEKVDKLCQKYSLLVVNKLEQGFINNQTGFVDPLQKFKQQSKVQLFEIKRM